MTRIHIILDEAEKERFRLQAEREAKSLAEWLREAGRQRLEAAERRSRMETLAELRAFFASCEAREREPEPTWEEHRRVIEGSIASGSADA